MRTFTWTKLGLVFRPELATWATRNASFPTAVLNGHRIRIYFTALDRQRRGSTGFVEVLADDPLKIVDVAPTPILTPGPAGAFDESGANVFSVVDLEDGTRRLYYQGWQLTGVAPFAIFSSVAREVFHDGTTKVQKLSRVPRLERTEGEPFLRGAPFVRFEDGRFRMWYCTGLEWRAKDKSFQYRVAMALTESADGLTWNGPSQILFTPEGSDYAVGRPSVLCLEGHYYMWYSIRSNAEPYRLGFAHSTDGRHWDRADAAVGLTRSDSGFDADMICYPNVIRVNDRLLMFYNGNQHGQSGFGVASAPI